ncbi:hypothetical protein [Methylosinus sp. C49]|uniref:hypothetical protein n=1 Tax=Methylosinus sp. C49 TaxID=2699395 RepID=UPI00137B5326|nr:hypothetical protein [Methylosinus sp. C49]
MTLSRLRPKLLLAMASLAPMAAPTPAAADFFFRPFGYAFHQPIPEPAPNATPRAIAGILGEEGFRLVGGLGRRGDQVVATGVDRRGHYRRFLIDPYEGEILRSWRIGPEEVGPGFVEAPPAAYRGPPGPEPYEGPSAGPAEDPLVVPGLGGEPRRPARQSNAPARGVETPARTHAAVRQDNAETRRPPHSPPSEATKPPARAAAPQDRPTAAKPAVAKPAVTKPAERKAPAQQPPQGGTASAPSSLSPAPSPSPAAASAQPIQAAPEPPHAAAPEPAAVGHQQAAPAPQTIVPATPVTPPPAAAAPANPVSAEQSKEPSAGEPPKPTPGG